MGTPQGLDPGSPSEDQLLSLYLAESLRDKSRGSGGRAYFKVVEELASLRKCTRNLDEDKAAHLSALLGGLASCVSLINPTTHYALLTELLGFPLWGLPGDICQTFLRLLTHVVINSSSLTHQCLQKLVTALLPPPFMTKDREAADLESDSDIMHMQIDIVKTIQQLLVLVPTAMSDLVAVAGTCMPHVLRDRAAHVLYVRSVLRLALAASGGAVRTGLLTAVMEHLVAMDCEIRWEEIAAHAEPEAEVPEEDEDIFQLEVQTEGMHVTQPGVASEAVEQARGEGAREGFEGALDSAPRDAGASASPSGRSAADHFAEKLDRLMEVALAHLEAALDQGQGPELWPAVAMVFQRTMLRAYKSKFAQYLLWYICMREPDTAPASLIAILLDKVISPSTQDTLRSAAAAYLASFCARARWLPAGLIADAVHQLAQWCLAYCHARPAQPAATALLRSSERRLISLRADAAAAANDLAMRHQAFYAACQGLFYILCFRLEGMLASSRNTGSVAADAALAPTLQELFSGTMLQLITHWLSPLAVCAPAVALEFAGLAERLGLLPANACAAAAAAAATHAQRPLEMFFPFDPYLLRESVERLQLGTSYLTWGCRNVRDAAEGTAGLDLQTSLHRRSGSVSSHPDDETDSQSSDTSGSEGSDTDSEAGSELPDGAQLSGDEGRSPSSDPPLTPAGLSRRASLPQKVPTLPSPHTPGAPAQRNRASAVGQPQDEGAEPAASMGSSPDMGSSADPMSWTPHIPLQLLQQTV